MVSGIKRSTIVNTDSGGTVTHKRGCDGSTQIYYRGATLDTDLWEVVQKWVSVCKTDVQRGAILAVAQPVEEG